MKDKDEDKRTKSDLDATEAGRSKSAPLSTAEYEVLRALAAGLCLQKIGTEWAFVGKWQNPKTSGVNCEVIDGLFGRGLISIHAGISEIGRSECLAASQKIIQIAHEWWKSHDLR